MNHVSEYPLTPPGVAELLADPNHYRRTPMECVDYGADFGSAEDLLPSLAPQPEPQPPGRWHRLWTWFTREAEA